MLFIILLFFPLPVFALSIYPNQVEIESNIGDEVTITFEAYNNDKSQEITLALVEDLTKSKEDETILDIFMLARDDRRKYPLYFIIEKSKEFYICFAQESRSFYARSCSRVIVTAK